MNRHSVKQFKNVCPRNCPSSCTMISYVKNDELVHIKGDPSHPYTKGKLCAKVFSDTERITHPGRLKHPYYQEVKGSGKFKKISWFKAYELIINKLLSINERHKNFLPFALYKGSGNIGLHHFVTDHLFSSIGKTTRIGGSSFLSTGLMSLQNEINCSKMPHPSSIKDSSLIIIWGANPAATNIHLIPIIIDAKLKGAKVVVIDPLKTKTAELADLYIQLRPSSDVLFVNALLKGLIKNGGMNQEYTENIIPDDFFRELKTIDCEEIYHKCEIEQEPVDLLIKWLNRATSVAYVLGNGLLKHFTGAQNLRAIKTITLVHGNLKKVKSSIFLRNFDSMIFNNQTFDYLSENRIVNLKELSSLTVHPDIEMLWISGANPMTQEPASKLVHNILKNIPFVVTVDQFLTPTAKMSNLILPTTTHYEETDIVTSFWHNEIAYNERALTPYFESRSEWYIMKELALKIKQHFPQQCSFPIHSSEEEYLNEQFNDKVFSRFHINSTDDLQRKSFTQKITDIDMRYSSFSSTTESSNIHIKEKEQKQIHLIPIKECEGKTPTCDYPFWLITPHHSYTFNSQYHFLNLDGEGEPNVEIHPEIAKKLRISNGEIIKVFNEQGIIVIKAVYSSQVPKDILVIYQGLYPDSHTNVNDLVSVSLTDSGENILGGSNFFSQYDTFVNVGKLQ